MRFQHAGRSTEGLVDTQLILMKPGSGPVTPSSMPAAATATFAIAATRFVGPNGKVYGVDNYEPAVTQFKESVARLRLPNVVPLVADITDRIPLDDGSVDICHMGSVYTASPRTTNRRPL